LFRLIFIALQNVGVISAAPCILEKTYDAQTHKCLSVSRSLCARYSLHSTFSALYYACNESEYRNYSVVHHPENQLGNKCGTV